MKPLALVLAAVAIAGLLAAAVPIGVAAMHFAVLTDRVSAAVDAGGGVEHLAGPAVDQLVDRLNESGYDLSPVDPDEPLLAQRSILISEGMNERVARHVIQRLLYLDRLDPDSPIELRISTSGGWTDSAFAIVDVMQSLDAPVNVTALGGCYSAGTVVLAAATGERAATPNTILSIHVNDYHRDGDPYDVDRQELTRFRELYRRYTRVPPAWFDAPGDHQYYLDARQALELGLIDRITKPERASRGAREAGEEAGGGTDAEGPSRSAA
ncbi:ATP-dependent Clp protease proteolytic subunit [Botrimarina sp.]|uniref:ATP-dependent Clp protease proteolytic subunit n=1 Tax=Botrimarina sp. TaxID=2795802 RepID=UPI0032EC7E1D